MKKIDFHVHIETDLPAEESARYFRDMCDRHGYSGINVLAYCYDAEEYNDFPEHYNRAALALKAAMGEGSFAFGCLLEGTDYARTAEELMQNGFDGIKLLRGGKPNYHKNYPYLYDDPIYEGFFALAEERGYPIIMHNNDPAYGWDLAKATPRAIQMGWVYDDTYPSHARYFEAVETVLRRHPQLRLALAHMGFYSECIDKAFALMETYPQLYMDMTPALNIYEELSQIPDRAKEFFLKYKDRCFLGTDAANHLVGEARAYNDLKNAVITHFFEGTGYRELSNESRPTPVAVAGLALPADVLKNIYYHNALRFIGKA
jgi:predicted TIM-barrel fold metal-dependent hydrolase